MLLFLHMLNHKTYTVTEAQKKLEHYCAYQERCHQEVRQKLRDILMTPEAIDQIMVYLIEHNFLNEERFAKTFVKGKFSTKKWGKHRLTSELKKRDVSKNNINVAIKEITEDEYTDTFNALAEKKAISISESNKLKKKRKLADYLLYRGWESHLVYDKVNELIP